jgi:hypothetical protein
MKYPNDPQAFIKVTGSMTARMHREATEQARRLGYGSLSGYIQDLIRGDLASAPTTVSASAATERLETESSHRTRRRRARK